MCHDRGRIDKIGDRLVDLDQGNGGLVVDRRALRRIYLKTIEVDARRLPQRRQLVTREITLSIDILVAPLTARPRQPDLQPPVPGKFQSPGLHRLLRCGEIRDTVAGRLNPAIEKEPDAHQVTDKIERRAFPETSYDVINATHPFNKWLDCALSL